MTQRMRRIAGVLALVAVLGTAAVAQPDNFGKNKVQYKHFTWSFIQSDHFDIYFAGDGEALAQFTAMAAESAYASISTLFRYQLVNRVPFVIYNSHNEFQQTNVISEYMEEGIGGVTELFKNRVVVPYEGDYGKFRHVIHHELVHAVMNDMFYGGSIQSIISNNISLQLPLWFSEGLAEYAALKWDTDSDMFLRDATVHEYLPPINQLYGYFAYRGGQSVFYYIARKYGEQKIGELLNKIKSARNLEQGMRSSIGLTVEELSERWQKDQKVTYWPDIARREDPGDYARRLTNHKKEGGFYNTSPAISPQGDRVAFISNRNDFFDVFVMDAVDGKDLEKIVDGQQTNNFEELHLLTPGIGWSPDGKRLAIATKAGERDAIMLVDVKSGEMEKLTFDLEGIFSVDWSPKGDRLAFVGNTAQQSDIYTYDLATRELINLTNDVYSDEQPCWSADGSTIFFSSDRASAEGATADAYVMLLRHQLDLFKIDVAGKSVTRLTDWMESGETSPVASPDGKKVLFVSDHNGINNIYELTIASGVIRPLTNSLSGVYQLSLSADGSKLAFSSLNQSGFDIFVMRSPFERDLKIAQVEPTVFRKVGDVPAPAKDTTAVAAKAVAQDPPGTAAPDTAGARVRDSLGTAVQVAAVTADTLAPAPKDTSGLYGQDIQLDFSNYVFAEPRAEMVPKDSSLARLPRIAGNMTEDGKFRVNKYKLNFSPDIVYGNAGYDTFYGVTGSTIMAFSDMLGDHQIVFATNLLLDLKNSDYALQYYYLPNRWDFGFGGFHSARFVIVNDVYGGSLYRFRTYGANVMALYPFDRYRRLEMGLSWFNISRENLDVSSDPAQSRSVVVPSISYTHDTSLWGLLNPVAGSRYRFDLYGTPKLGANGLSFVNVTGDYRTYLRLGRGYSIALRLAGGGSFGKNPQKYIIGGVDNWINHTFEGGYIPLENAEDYIFLQAGLPLRGHNYNAAIGSKYSLFNFELRYPLFAFLQAGPLPLGLQSLGGVMFFDMGSAWNKERNYVAFTKNENGATVTRDLLMGMGTGTRIFFLAFLLRLDVAWAWDYNSFSPPKYYFSLGLDF